MAEIGGYEWPMIKKMEIIFCLTFMRAQTKTMEGQIQLGQDTIVRKGDQKAAIRHGRAGATYYVSGAGTYGQRSVLVD